MKRESFLILSLNGSGLRLVSEREGWREVLRDEPRRSFVGHRAQVGAMP